MALYCADCLYHYRLLLGHEVGTNALGTGIGRSGYAVRLTFENVEGVIQVVGGRLRQSECQFGVCLTDGDDQSIVFREGCPFKAGVIQAVNLPEQVVVYAAMFAGKQLVT